MKDRMKARHHSAVVENNDNTILYGKSVPLAQRVKNALQVIVTV
jgi:hypothetical protein